MTKPYLAVVDNLDLLLGDLDVLALLVVHGDAALGGDGVLLVGAVLAVIEAGHQGGSEELGVSLGHGGGPGNEEEAGELQQRSQLRPHKIILTRYLQ